MKTAELHSAAEDYPEEKHIVELVTQIENPQLPSDNDIKRFDVVVDCSDHHFVKESGHENVILYLIQSCLFIYLNFSVYCSMCKFFVIIINF